MKETYLNLFADGWTMNDIEDMDIFWYWECLAYKANKKEQDDLGYIDSVL